MRRTLLSDPFVTGRAQEMPRRRVSRQYCAQGCAGGAGRLERSRLGAGRPAGRRPWGMRKKQSRQAGAAHQMREGTGLPRV